MSWVTVYYTQILGLYHHLCAFLLGLRIWKCSLACGQRIDALTGIFQYVSDGLCEMEQDL